MAGGCKKNGGKRAGAGRKSKAEELGLVALLDKCFTVEDREKLFKNLVRQATGAMFNLEAAKLLLAYTYGKPLDRKEITGGSGEPLLAPLERALEKIYGNS